MRYHERFEKVSKYIIIILTRFEVFSLEVSYFSVEVSYFSLVSYIFLTAVAHYVQAIIIIILS